MCHEYETEIKFSEDITNRSQNSHAITFNFLWILAFLAVTAVQAPPKVCLRASGKYIKGHKMELHSKFCKSWYLRLQV